MKFYYRAFIPDPISRLDIAFSLDEIAKSAISGLDAVATAAAAG